MSLDIDDHCGADWQGPAFGPELHGQLKSGFALGGAGDGTLLAQGWFDEVATFWLWLGIGPAASNAVPLTLWNTVPARSYGLWSRQNFLSGSWGLGDKSDRRQRPGFHRGPLVPMAGRTNLFFRASEARVYGVDTNAGFSVIAIKKPEIYNRELAWIPTDRPDLTVPPALSSVSPRICRDFEWNVIYTMY